MNIDMTMIALCMFSASTTLCVITVVLQSLLVTRLRGRVEEMEKRTRWLLPARDKEFEEIHDNRGWRKEHYSTH